MNFSLIIEGIGAGLLLAVMIGPVFFFLLQTSLKFGFRIAVYAVLGIMCSDLFCILLSYFGLYQFVNGWLKNPVTEIIAGIVFVGFGISYIFKKTAQNSPNVGSKKQNIFQAFAGGFMLNMLSPSVLIFWIATMSVVLSEYDTQPLAPIYFFTSLLATTFLTDISKAFVATRLRKFINEKSTKILNSIIAISMMGMGITLIVKGILK